jgi:hypothetical protein
VATLANACCAALGQYWVMLLPLRLATITPVARLLSGIAAARLATAIGGAEGTAKFEAEHPLAIRTSAAAPAVQNR